MTRKIRFWNKVEALEKLMRHLGMLEKDRSAVNVQVNLNLTPHEPEPVELKFAYQERSINSQATPVAELSKLGR